jgi:riboflavin kinase
MGEMLEGTVILLERTHYDDSVLEVIAPINIREELKLKDGDNISVLIYPLQGNPKAS